MEKTKLYVLCIFSKELTKVNKILIKGGNFALP